MVSPLTAQTEPNPPDSADLEARIQDLGRSLLFAARLSPWRFLTSAFWSDVLMDWATRDEGFKQQLFRFVDVLPALKTPKQIHDHLLDYLVQPGVKLPPGMRPALRAGGLFKSAAGRVLTWQVSSMARRFIAAADADEAVPVLRRLWKNDTGHTVTPLGEKCVSHVDADKYQAIYRDLLRKVSDDAARWPDSERAGSDHLGSIPRVNLSVKVSSLHADPDPADRDRVVDAIFDRLLPILNEAEQRGVQIHLDMEQVRLKEIVLGVLKRSAEAVDTPIGVVLQAYLRSAEEDAQHLIKWAKGSGRQITIRLVKGAYWDYESAHALGMGWPVPVWSRKHQSDACFERVAALLVDAIPGSASSGGIKLALGSHNVRSISSVLALIEKRGFPDSAVELQMLYGMADELKSAVNARRLRLREYVPVGSMVPGMAYLVRRLLENTSNESWLKAGSEPNADPARLLASPHDAGPADLDADAAADLSPAAGGEGASPERSYARLPPRDFSIASVRQQFRAALDQFSPCGRCDEEGQALEAAIEAARAASPDWRRREPAERVAAVLRAADAMASARDGLAAQLVHEAGLTWRQADAEVCRAVDSCRCLASRAAHGHDAGPVAAESGGTHASVHPAGPVRIVASWRQPLSWTVGQAARSMIAGNTVLLSPSSFLPGLGESCFGFLNGAGCPAGVLRLLAPYKPAIARKLDGEAGDDHAEPGTSPPTITDAAAAKSAIIVDASADLDAAVWATRQCAFIHNGQSPLACGLALVHRRIHDEFVGRLCESVADLRIGDPRDPGVSIGPLAAGPVQRAVMTGIEGGRGEARRLLAMKLPQPSRLQPHRPYVPPHVFMGCPPTGQLARNDIPGPVLAIIRVDGFADALQVLGGIRRLRACAVYSRTPTSVRHARDSRRIRRLLVNQPTTDVPVGDATHPAAHATPA